MSVVFLVQENMKQFNDIQQKVGEIKKNALETPSSDLKELLRYHQSLSVLYERAEVIGEILINTMKSHRVPYDENRFKEVILHLKSHRKEKAKNLLKCYPPSLALSIYFDHYPKVANNYHVQRDFSYFFSNL